MMKIEPAKGNFIEVVFKVEDPNASGPNKAIADTVEEAVAGSGNSGAVFQYGLINQAKDTMVKNYTDVAAKSADKKVREKALTGANLVSVVGAGVMTAVAAYGTVSSFVDFFANQTLMASGNTALQNHYNNVTSNIGSAATRITTGVGTGALVGSKIASKMNNKTFGGAAGVAIGLATVAVQMAADYMARNAQKQNELLQEAVESAKKTNRLGIVSGGRGRVGSGDYKM